MFSKTFSLWDLVFVHINLLRVDHRCIKNLSKYCTCSIFCMISTSSIFAIFILHHFFLMFGCWAPPTFSAGGWHERVCKYWCLATRVRQSLLQSGQNQRKLGPVSTRFLDLGNRDFIHAMLAKHFKHFIFSRCLIKMLEATMMSKSLVCASFCEKLERTTWISSVFLHLHRPFNRPLSPKKGTSWLVSICSCAGIQTQLPPWLSCNPWFEGVENGDFVGFGAKILPKYQHPKTQIVRAGSLSQKESSALEKMSSLFRDA